MFHLFHYLRLRLTVAVIRLLMRLRRRAPPPLPHPTPTRTVNIPSRDPGRHIKATLYTPPDAPSHPLPTLLNFHGSGFVLPMHGTDAPYCALVARATRSAVLDCAYRLAPEHPFPAALEDARDALAWVRAQPGLFDARRLSVSGFSAGANLALVLAGAAGESSDAFRCVVAFYPPVDLSVEPGEKRAPDEVVGRQKGIPAGLARLFDACYMPDGVDRKDPRVSPRWAGMGGWPGEVVVLTAAGDTLALEAEALAAAIEEGEKGRVRVVTKRFEGVGHAWDKGEVEGSAEEEATREAYEIAVDVLKKAASGE
ncbi:Alpha/Beta hydrolase protein [Macrophomina phaseolina]|uniref:Alpha/Beta hydrolase protein n=1 Tax=Macrophomina phaseolina TaxID=35725 RepID=A0ABQ8GD50_9PEZI|nr:Alpha/Beta hydrolase protein [Macrophomina phaseolina]